MLIRPIGVLVFTTLFGTFLAGQGMTLRDAVIARGGPVVNSVGTESLLRPLAMLASNATLIVRGTVRPIRTYLSGDEMLIYTDFELTPVAIIAESIIAGRTPGPSPVVVVKQLGGTMNIAGFDMTVVDEGVKTLPSNTPLILFLEGVPQESKYQLIGERSGAFDVSSGTVMPLTHRTGSDNYAGMGVSAFVNEVNRLRGAGNK
jgi:hypothetical protein